MLLGMLMLSLHCSNSFRECALDRYICPKEARRESERVGHTQSPMPRNLDVRRLQAVGVCLSLVSTGARKTEREAYADENGHARRPWKDMRS